MSFVGFKHSFSSSDFSQDLLFHNLSLSFFFLERRKRKTKGQKTKLAKLVHTKFVEKEVEEK